MNNGVRVEATLDDAFDRTADLCVAACTAALSNGSAEMRAAARLLLHALGREIAKRERAQQGDDDPV